MTETATPRDIVLIVDDSPEALGFLTEALEQSGFSVLIATSGASALNIVDRITPDIILLDAVMPGLDGFETCLRFKANPAIAIPLTQTFLKVKDPADAKAAYEAYVKIYPGDLQPSLEGIKLVLEELALKNPKAKAMKPEQIVDTSVLGELRKDGFFKKLGL